jgi:hypothetical protein
MSDIRNFQLAAKSVRQWREMELKLLKEAGCDDFSYRPKTGMSSLGWILAHQAAIYDFSINMLIEQGPPMNSKMFELYRPGTSGDWAGTPLSEIQEYFDATEANLLDWIKKAEPTDFEQVIEEGPSFFIDMTNREAITNAFTHLNYHTGHLAALRRDWIKQNQSE